MTKSTEKKTHSRTAGVLVKDHANKVSFFFDRKGVGEGGVRCVHIDKFPFRYRKDMALALKVSDAQLEGSKKAGGSLTLPTLDALAAYFGFDHTWVEFRSGSVEEFAEKYNRENWFKPKGPEQPVRIARGPRQEPCPSAIKGLASIAIDGYQFNAGTALIDLEVTCGAPYICGFPATVRAGLVELDCGSNGLLTNKSWRDDWITKPPHEAKGTKGVVVFECAGGTRKKPIWRLSTRGASIGNLILDPGFAVLEGLFPGDVVAVRFGTWLMDIRAGGECGPDDDGGGVVVFEKDGTELPTSSQEYSVLKRRVMDCIAKKAIPADDGYVTLATHELHIVEEVVRDD